MAGGEAEKLAVENGRGVEVGGEEADGGDAGDGGTGLGEGGSGEVKEGKEGNEVEERMAGRIAVRGWIG